MTKTIDIKKTYKKGDTVSIGGTVYELSDEKVDKGCDGCAFINRYDCEKLRAHICRAGLIFKKVKK